MKNIDTIEIRQQHPDWVNRAFVEKQFLPWYKATPMTFEDFNRGYTLHDSYWVSAVNQFEHSVIIGIWWDIMWVKRTKLPVPSDIQFAYLFIKLDEVKEIHLSFPNEAYGIDSIGRAQSTQVDDCKMVEFTSNVNGAIYIVYSGVSMFMMFDDDMNVMPIMDYWRDPR